jgi:hypothetical protein
MDMNLMLNRQLKRACQSHIFDSFGQLNVSLRLSSALSVKLWGTVIAGSK